MQKIVLIVLLSVFAGCFARPAAQDNSATSTAEAPVPYNEEIKVETSLIVTKPRQKRQFGGFGGGGDYGQSSALANANAYNQHSGPGGFGSSAANAGAQSFRSQGPLGGFGASAANAGSQGFEVGPGGISGSAGMSGSQTYDLPGGRHVNLAYGQGFSHANGNPSITNSNSLTYSK